MAKAAARQEQPGTSRGQAPEGERPGGAEQAQHVRPPDVAVVWKLHFDKTIEPVRIKTGITDHTVTEVVQVLKGELKEGDELVVGSTSLTPGANRPPGMGGPMGGGPRR